MKKSKIIAYLLFLMFSFSSVAALADPIELYDRDSSISGTDLVTFSAKINDYLISANLPLGVVLLPAASLF